MVFWLIGMRGRRELLMGENKRERNTSETRGQTGLFIPAQTFAPGQHLQRGRLLTLRHSATASDRRSGTAVIDGRCGRDLDTKATTSLRRRNGTLHLPFCESLSAD